MFLTHDEGRTGSKRQIFTTRLSPVQCHRITLNQILTTLADMVHDQMLDKVKSAKFFSLLVDQSKDISKKTNSYRIVGFFLITAAYMNVFKSLSQHSRLDAKS